jgi:replicative DNA helicase
VRRELIKAAADITAQAHDQTVTSRETLEEAQKRIFELTDLHRTHEILDAEKIVQETQSLLEKRVAMINSDGITGIPSGIIQLDEMTSGFHEEELIVIGARPGMGKTARALSMLQHITVDKHIPAGFFSLEMSVTEIGQRMIAQISHVPQDKMRKGLLSVPQWGMINDAAASFYDAPFYMVDSPSLKMLDIRALARNMVATNAVRIIFIDYISLITAENPYLERHLQVAEFSRSLKALARELKIPVVVLSQVGRTAEKSKEVALNELRESGAIEQDADMVIFINRDRGEGNEPTIPATLSLAKQRNGPTGSAKCLFIPQYTKFENPTAERS